MLLYIQSFYYKKILSFYALKSIENFSHHFNIGICTLKKNSRQNMKFITTKLA